jgi:hypothetical protein
VAGTIIMAKKPARKPTLSSEQKDKIRAEYRLGDTVAELSRAYNRGTSIISRIVNTNGVSREGEMLASRLADVRGDIGIQSGREQYLILERAKQLKEIKDLTIKGTQYIAERTLKKLKGSSDVKINFNDLLQSQGIMTKANALVEPKIANQVNVNTQVNVQMGKAEVKTELLAEGIPEDVLDYLND